MSETTEPYRIALETEIHRWDGFVRALRKDDREAFEQMIDTCRSYALEVCKADNSTLFEPFVMSILLGIQKKLRATEEDLARQTQKVT